MDDQQLTDTILASVLSGLTFVIPLLIYIGLCCSRCCCEENDIARLEASLDSDGAVQKPADIGCSACTRIFSAVFNFAWWLWIIGLIVFHTVPVVTLPYLYIAVVVYSAVLPLFFLIESAFSRERRYLHNLNHIITIAEYLEGLRTTPPEITMHAVCYHYETRTRFVTRTDSSGRSYTATETYQEMVVTARFCESFSFNSWNDVSAPGVREEFSEHAVMRIKMRLVVNFGDSLTLEAFQRQYNAFQERYRHVDVHQNFWYQPTVQGFEKHLAAYADRRKVQWWMHKGYFWLSTLLFIPWLFRLLFNCFSSQTSYTLAKDVYLTAAPPLLALVVPLSY